MKKFLGLILMSVVLFLIFYGGKNQFTPDEFVDAMYEKFDFVHQDYIPATDGGFIYFPEVKERYVCIPKSGVTDEELKEKITIIGVAKRTLQLGGCQFVEFDTYKKINDNRFSKKNQFFWIMAYGNIKNFSNVSEGDKIKMTLTWNNLAADIGEKTREDSWDRYIDLNGKITIFSTTGDRNFEILVEKTSL